MAAIVGFVLDRRFSKTAIAEIIVTSDGFLLARAEGEVGANHFIGSHAELMRNWLALIAAAGLTTHEWIEAAALFAANMEPQRVALYARVSTLAAQNPERSHKGRN